MGCISIEDIVTIIATMHNVDIVFSEGVETVVAIVSKPLE